MANENTNIIGSGLQGLGNIGNTCGVNTLVQCIGHMNVLRKLLLADNIKCHPNRQGICLTLELQEILKHLWINDKSVIPHKFIKSLHGTLGSDLFPRGEQLDMGELWIYILSIIEEELGEENVAWAEEHPKKVLGMLSPQSDREYLELVKNSETYWAKSIHKCVSSWALQSQGLIHHQITCSSCKFKSDSYENFTCLSVPIPEYAETMEQCLHAYFSDELLPEWKCEKCNHVGGQKSCRLWRTPMMLSITLKRFAYSDRLAKISRSISIPQYVRLNQFCIGPYKLPKYALKGVGTHQGGYHGGHYVATCKCPNDQTWWRHDDLTVSKIDEKHLRTELSNAYMCFYEPDNM